MLSKLQQMDYPFTEDELDEFQAGCHAHVFFTMEKLIEFMTLEELNEIIADVTSNIAASEAGKGKPDLHLV